MIDPIVPSLASHSFTASYIHCIYTNAQSLYNKLSELRQRCHAETKLIAITESWLSPSITDGEIFIPNMNIFRADRPNERGGGVALYLHSSFQANVLSDPVLDKSTDTLWCSVNLANHDKWLIGVIYRPPNSDPSRDSSLLDALERALSLRYTHVLLMGDFNLPQIDFTSSAVEGSQDSTAATFFHLVNDHGLCEHALQNTRWASTCSASKLDYVFTNEDLMVDQVSASAPLGRSDHALLDFNFILNTSLRKPLNHPRFNFRRANIPLIQSVARSADWDSLPHLHIDDMCALFHSTLTSALNQSVPLKQSAPLRHRKSLRSRTIKWIRLKAQAWSTFKCSGCLEDFEDYKRIRNKTTKLIRSDRSAYQRSLTERFLKDPKQLYRFVSSQRKAKAGISQLVGPSGPTATDSEAATVLAEQYLSVFTSSSVPPPLDPCPSNSSYPPLFSVDTSPEAILRKLLTLKDTSPGPDGIPPVILTSAACQLAAPLSVIFSASIDRGYFPPAWKTSNITPIYKGGKRGEPQNYRPIALLSSVSKVLEMLVHDCLSSHLESNNFLSPDQHGFRKGRSCTTNLLTAADDWTKAADHHWPVDVIYFDFSKAFDRVNHTVLYRRLQELNIQDPLLSWLKSYLANRSFRVRVNNSLSPILPSLSGVPQGSILGPLLFLIVINSASFHLSSPIKVFADDIKIWRIIQSQDDSLILQQDIDRLCDWSEHNLLPLNPAKCTHLPLRHSSPSCYSLRGAPIPKVAVQKDLGVLISSSLSSSPHCTAIAKRASQNLGILRRIFGKFDPHCFHNLFNAFVRPHLENGTSVCPPYLQKDKLQLERIQRRATKCVIGLQNLPYELRLSSLNMFPLEYRRLRGDLIFTFLLSKNPKHPCNALLIPSRVPHLRGHDLKMAAQQSRLDCRHHFFSLRIVKPWNALPNHVVSVNTLAEFKHRLDMYLFFTP